MTDVRITCVTVSGTQRTHQHITHVGSPQFNGGTWTVAQVVAAIENNNHTFYVQDIYGNRASVGVVDPGNGNRKFIRTYADKTWTDNLLSLPAC
ncbi:DUF3892 domain-containing protein [Rahnella aceris]|uniref:DUF3892 domain-containing protein n=1 Tax=Rahnella sp. (strain Y9602) TaxID=2703885 RepID=UPI001F53DD48|nr:DUF3892 domain-containing protein [Rahnella aceris]UNK55620.1 DUF3892 domain-containing protein [Rahnella aceris]